MQVINHGVPKKLRDEMINSTETFFNLTEEEKQEYRGNELLDPIKCGTSFNVRVDKSLLWRDYLKILVHPHFVSPHKPAGFRYTNCFYISTACMPSTRLLDFKCK